MSKTFITSPEQIIDGAYYALPYEVDLMERELEAMKLKRGGIALHIEEAMAQSSETWHDNAPADALFGEMGMIDQRESSLRKAKKKLHLLEYPPENLDVVTIGSRALISMGGDEFFMDITGNLPLNMPHEEGVEVGSIAAPMPRAALGVRPGEAAGLKVENRDLAFTVLDLDQTAQRIFYENLG